MMQTQLHVKDGILTVQATQDCTPIAEYCKTLHNEGVHGSNEMRHAASIPHVAIEAYLNQHGITYAEWIGNPVHIKRMCNDPDLRDFRIWPGRV